MASLAEIRAALAAKEAESKAREEKRSGGGSTGGDNAQYPFWDIKVGESAKIRLLQDGNDDNVYPWVERHTIELEFDGTINGEQDTTQKVKVKFNCPSMFAAIIPGYKVPCKITAHINPWWKEPKGSDTYKQAQKYYKKKTWLTQGFVVESPFTEENAPENPVRRFTLTKEIFDRVFKAYNGTEFEEAPHDFDGGTDFTITKTLQGEYNNYDTSDYARRARSLSAEERAAVEQYGLFVLKDFVGKAPTEEDAEIQYQMFLDALAGKPYDFAKFGEHYRPWGVRGPAQSNGNSNNSDTSNAGTPSSEDRTDNAQSEASADTGAAEASKAVDTEDLIARIRRNAMNKA